MLSNRIKSQGPSFADTRTRSTHSLDDDFLEKMVPSERVNLPRVSINKKHLPNLNVNKYYTL